MANEEHLGMLRQGVNVWNRWRKVDPMSLPDLIRADFRNANLSEADLSFTYHYSCTSLEPDGAPASVLSSPGARKP